jgi:hypothetical protein
VVSTKMLRRILETHRALGPDVRTTSAADMHVALGEMEAIERAAKDACRGNVTHRLSASDEGLELAMLLESIAKDAP